MLRYSLCVSYVLVAVGLDVGTSVVECRERLVCEMMCYVLSGRYSLLTHRNNWEPLCF